MKRLILATVVVLSLIAVTAAAQERTADTVSVMGEVRQPGSYEVRSNGTMTLPEALARARGFTLRADKRNAKITRSDGEVIVIDLGDVLTGKAADLPLKAGDSLVVPKLRR